MIISQHMSELHWENQLLNVYQPLVHLRLESDRGLSRLPHCGIFRLYFTFLINARLGHRLWSESHAQQPAKARLLRSAAFWAPQPRPSKSDHSCCLRRVVLCQHSSTPTHARTPFLQFCTYSTNWVASVSLRNDVLNWLLWFCCDFTFTSQVHEEQEKLSLPHFTFFMFF